MSSENSAVLERSAQLYHKTVGDIRGCFFVAGYQRGYRWGEDEVHRLLDDIFATEGENYSLQPVVLKLRRAGSEPSEFEWELIDGQQRLTTLYLILRYMQNELSEGIGAPYAIRYETRENSGRFLEAIGLGDVGEDRNIDYFHLQRAYRAIDDWFARFGDRHSRNDVAATLRGYLRKSVRVIWYEAPSHVKAIPLFIRLNVGRIPLTAAELVKAELLSAVLADAPGRAHEVAAQWDTIERDLHDRDIWAFVAGMEGADAAERYPTRISLLLDALAAAVKLPAGRHDRYHTFDTLSPSITQAWKAVWDEILAMHAQLLGWYRLPSIYNKIGFLVMTGTPFGKYVVDARQMKKSEFDGFLQREIRERIRMSASRLDDLQYAAQRYELMNVLALMNVETATRAGQRFPFAEHIGPGWSLEHIHAQHPEGLNKSEQWNIWLSTHRAALVAVGREHDPAASAEFEARVDRALAQIATGKAGAFTGDDFNALSADIVRFLGDGQEVDHGIGNMALLSSAHNSRLNNSVFEVKRQMILELDREGQYVPQCTRNIFLKYYADADAQQPHFWSERDKAAYLRAMHAVLQPYLT